MTPATDVFSNPYEFIPELKAMRDKGKAQGDAIGPGLSSIGPGIELVPHKVTIKQILDAVAIADASISLATQKTPVRPPMSWALKSQVDAETGNRVDS